MSSKRRYYPRRYYRYRRPTRSSSFTRKIYRSINQRDTCRIILTSKPEQMRIKFWQDDQQANLGMFTSVITFNPLVDLFGGKYVSNGQSVDIPAIPSFDRFRVLFDQVKINAIRLKIQIVAQPVSTSNAAIIIRNALDRNGLAKPFSDKLTDQTTFAKVYECSSDLESYSSFTSNIVNINDLYSLYRSFYPYGLQQRGIWYGCSQKFNYPDKGSINAAEFQFPFKPILMLQFYTNMSAIPTNGDLHEIINVSYEYDVTFRGQRNIS